MKHPLSLQGLIEWLKTKSGPYNYSNIQYCAAAQYNEYLGREYKVQGIHGVSRRKPSECSFDEALEFLSIESNRTFEDLLKNAECALAHDTWR